jgi:HEAT repeat protein
MYQEEAEPVSSLRKERIRSLVEARDLAGLVSWAGESRDPLGGLFSLTYDKDDLTRWRAIEAIGIAGAQLAKTDLERVREFIRRLLWLMNDESGGVGWHAPEAIGELLFRTPSLIEQYGRLLPQFLSEPPFAVGAHFAIARIAPLDRELISECSGTLRESLKSEEPTIRAYASIALGEKSVMDDAEITLYDFAGGELYPTTVAKSLRTFPTRR